MKSFIHLFIIFIIHLFICGVACLYPGYSVSQINQQAYGYQGSLSLKGPGPYGNDIASPTFEVYYQTEDILRIKIYDPNNARWEVPNVNQLNPPTSAPTNTNYKVSFVNDPFGFTVTRTSNNDVIFDTTSSKFNPILFADQYLELTTSLPNNPNIYGLGERITNFRLPLNNNYTIWNIDQGTPMMKNLYGTHPFYLEMRPTGLAHGVFILNSNAQDWELQDNSLTYKSIGGIFDIFIFLGPTPAQVVQQYQSVIGFPHFPPYWGLGWHQCRWGYNNLSETQAVVENYAKYGIPLDTMWNDIDYMDSYRDFTNDPTRFPPEEVRQWVQDLHNNGQHYIMIVDPGISILPGYASYDQLMESKAFIKSYNSDSPILGKVWPGEVYFPDFSHPNATAYWLDQVTAFHSTGPEFDGMWIDMNEISNFCDGQCDSEGVRQVRATLQSYDNPPYVPGGVMLDTKTVNVTAQQYNGIMYNTHNMYGWSEGIASKYALEKLRGSRSVVISRSTFASSGRHNGHWLGDNDSSFADLYNSISGILSMQLYGINFVGADICGFGGDTTAELCSRWMQLGSLYPFSRNHNSIGNIPQEPYAFGEPLLSISISALKTRYTLLPYFYTLFAGSHNAGTTVWRPLFFEFPTDLNTFGIDAQFMIGEALLVTPVVTEGATTVSGYFPVATWYNYYDGTLLVGNATSVTLQAPLDFIPIHVRGGTIVPLQTPANTTTMGRTLPFGLLVALDKNGQSTGSIYIDDGESLDPITEFSQIEYNVNTANGGCALTSTLISKAYTTDVPPLGWVTVYGVQTAPSKVVLNGSPLSFSYDPKLQVLQIDTANAPMVAAFTLNWG